MVGIDDARRMVRLNNIANDLGLDTASAGSAIAWAIELYQRGIIGPAQTGGLELRWGDADSVERLLFMTARREGFGDVLAESARAVDAGKYPPEALASRYVDVIGGVDATVEKARGYADDGDLRFAAELANHALFADPKHEGARALQTEVFTRLGHGSECGTWRNNFLTGAKELQEGPIPLMTRAAGMAAALTVTQLFDSIAIRLDANRAWSASASVRWHFTDTGETHRMELSNGVLVHFPTQKEEPADLIVSLTKRKLLGLLGGAGPDGLDLEGDPSALTTIMSLLDVPDPAFAIVVP